MDTRSTRYIKGLLISTTGGLKAVQLQRKIYESTLTYHCVFFREVSPLEWNACVMADLPEHASPTEEKRER